MINFILKRQKGFTLVELLIVIIILGILVGIATPLYIDMTESSKIAALVSNHDTYVYAAKIYTMNNNELPTSKEDLSSYISKKNYDFDGNPQGSIYKIENDKIIAELKLKKTAEIYRVEYQMVK